MKTLGKTSLRPWGWYRVLQKVPTIKVLFIKRGCRTSLQRHLRRQEHMIILDGSCSIELNGWQDTFVPTQSIVIPPETNHRITAYTDTKILEVWFGDSDESDIIRVEDDYGRVQSNRYYKWRI